MDKYFERIYSLTTHKELPSRIRFMLLDMIELRRNQVRREGGEGGREEGGRGGWEGGREGGGRDGASKKERVSNVDY